MNWKSVPCLVIVLIIGIALGSCSKANEQKEADVENNNTKDTIAGHWTGGIKIPESPLHIQIDLQQDGQSTEGMISIPAQGLNQYPLQFVDVEENNIKLGFESQGQLLTFDGSVKSEQITGTFRQAGHSFDFELFKADNTDDTIGEKFETKTTQGKIKGELLDPQKSGKTPVMLIIPGSGPVDRNGNTLAGENNSLKMLAQLLAKRGVATVRYDKRVVADNETEAPLEEDMRFERLIDDAKARIKQLKKDDRFSKVGIIGHSQGSLVGMVAGSEVDADLFVSIAGAGRTIDEVMQDQLRDQLSDDLLKKSQSIFDTLKKGETVDDVANELMSVLNPKRQPFLASWMKYDPADEIDRLDMPVLIVNGTHDVQVSKSEAELLEQARQNADTLFVDGMNHVLKEAPQDRQKNMQVYWNPRLSLAQELITGLEDFLMKNDWIESESNG